MDGVRRGGLVPERAGAHGAIALGRIEGMRFRWLWPRILRFFGRLREQTST